MMARALVFMRIEPACLCRLDGSLMLPSFPLLTVTYDISHLIVVPTNGNQLIVSPLDLCSHLLPTS
jgi:hypothetical protein